jgi:hypothetical protein
LSGRFKGARRNLLALAGPVMMAIVFTFGWSQPPDKVGQVIGTIGESRTVGYADHGAAGIGFLIGLSFRLLVMALQLAGWGFALGTLLFSGLLYAMALGAPRWFGAVVPLGGVAFLAGWVALGWYALRGR